MQTFTHFCRLAEAARVPFPVPGLSAALSVVIDHDVLDHHPIYRVIAGPEKVGYAKLSGDGRSVMDIVIAPAWQRRGIASALYDFIEQHRNITLRPSPMSQTPAGKAFWAARQRRLAEAPAEVAQVTALLATKAMTDMQRRTIQRTLAANDPVRVRQALAWLQKQPTAVSAADTATFDRAWKARPLFTPKSQRHGESTEAAYRRYAQTLTQYYRTHFGGPRVWTDALMNRYLDAATQDRPRIRFQGTTYPLTTGMDEREFVWAVLHHGDA